MQTWASIFSFFPESSLSHARFGSAEHADICSFSGISQSVHTHRAQQLHFLFAYRCRYPGVKLLSIERIRHLLAIPFTYISVLTFVEKISLSWKMFHLCTAAGRGQDILLCVSTSTSPRGIISSKVNVFKLPETVRMTPCTHTDTH